MSAGVLDITPLLRKYGQLASFTKQELGVVIRQEATLFIYNPGKTPGVINITAPFNARDSRPQAALFSARAAIDRDLAAVFQPVSIKGQRTITKVFGKPLASPVTVATKERYPDVQAIATQRWKRKNERGQRIMSRGQKAPFYVDRSKLEIVRKESYSMIGLACACWYLAATQAGLSPRGVPEWVRRHTSAFSAGEIKITAHGLTITLSSRLPYNTALNMQSKMQRVLGYRDASLTRRLPYVIAAAARKAKLLAA